MSHSNLDRVISTPYVFVVLLRFSNLQTQFKNSLKFSVHFTVTTLRLYYEDEPVHAVPEKVIISAVTYNYTVWPQRNEVLNAKSGGTYQHYKPCAQCTWANQPLSTARTIDGQSPLLTWLRAFLSQLFDSQCIPNTTTTSQHHPMLHLTGRPSFEPWRRFTLDVTH